jgi:hypothetical protein
VQERRPRLARDDQRRDFRQRDAEQRARDAGGDAMSEEVERMLTPSLEPGQLARGVVDAVQPPQPRQAVHGAVQQVADEIGEHEGHREPGCRGSRVARAGALERPEQQRRQHRHQRGIHEEAGDAEQRGRTRRPVAVARDQALERHHDPGAQRQHDGRAEQRRHLSTLRRPRR